ncbi:alpha/beta hydrolase [Martelella alba]|nr:alpha/beta hydrolase fold domain-containing protein [Martelella alba]
MTTPAYDQQLQQLLNIVRDYVPLKMTLVDLPRFRGLSSPSRQDLIAVRPVECRDFTIPGFRDDDIIVSVLSGRDHETAGPGIYFLHGGGMVMGNRFVAAAPLVDWCLRYDAVCVTAEYRLAPENPAQFRAETNGGGKEHRLRINAFWASENFDSFISSTPSPSQKNTAENSNIKRSSFQGAEHPQWHAVAR